MRTVGLGVTPKVDTKDMKAQVKALTGENDALKAQVEALTGENDALKAQVEDLTGKLAATAQAR